MQQSEITFRVATQFHMFRHFELNPQILIEEVLSKGYNQKQVSDAINLPGSRFYSSFANDIPTLLEKVFAIGFEQSTGVNKNIVLYGKMPEVLFPNGIGNVGVVTKKNLTHIEQEQIYSSNNRSNKLLHLNVSLLPSTNEFVIVLKKTTNNYLFITGFPGSLAMPLPSSKMNPALRKLSREFWKEHVFLVKV
jgi:hypothetical protein